MAYKIINASPGDLLDLRMTNGSFKIVNEITDAMRRHEARGELSIIDLSKTHTEDPAPVEAPTPTPAASVTPAQETTNVQAKDADAAPGGNSGPQPSGAGDAGAVSEQPKQDSTPEKAPAAPSQPQQQPFRGGNNGGNNRR